MLAVRPPIIIAWGVFRSYSDTMSVFYARYFGMLVEAMRTQLGACRQEIGDLNRRVGYEMVRFDPLAGMKA